MVVQALWGSSSKPENTMWLWFFGVLFFEGGMRWKGAKFETGTPEQQTEIMHRIGYGDATDKELPSVQLYQIRDVSAQENLFKVRIIANGVTVKFEPFKIGDFDTL